MFFAVDVVYIDYAIDNFYKKCTKILEWNFCFCLKLTEKFDIISLYSYVLLLCTNLI